MAARRATKPKRQQRPSLPPPTQPWRKDSPFSPIMRLLYGQPPKRVHDSDPRPHKWGVGPTELPTYRQPGLVVPANELPAYDDDPRRNQTRPGGGENPPMGLTPWGTQVPFPLYGGGGRRGRA